RDDLLPHFVFSSRSRHTRFSRDWSSDVCSSDLAALLGARGLRLSSRWATLRFALGLRARGWRTEPGQTVGRLLADARQPDDAVRSEERRVGKEGGARRPADHWSARARETGRVGW